TFRFSAMSAAALMSPAMPARPSSAADSADSAGGGGRAAPGSPTSTSAPSATSSPTTSTASTTAACAATAAGPSSGAHTRYIQRNSQQQQQQLQQQQQQLQQQQQKLQQERQPDRHTRTHALSVAFRTWARRVLRYLSPLSIQHRQSIPTSSPCHSCSTASCHLPRDRPAPSTETSGAAATPMVTSTGSNPSSPGSVGRACPPATPPPGATSSTGAA
ncbi:unnamed protein product, partial [Sphagnum tenellum]